MYMDTAIVCSHPAMFVIFSHLPLCCLFSSHPVPALLHSFLPHLYFPIFKVSYPPQAAYFHLLVHFFLFSLSLAPCINQYCLLFSVSLHCYYHIPSFLDFLPFSMPSSAFSHGLVHLSVSCLSQRICLFISLLSPYSCVCFQCLYTQASPLPLHTFHLHGSLLLHSLFSTVFLQQVTFSCLLSVFYMNFFAKVL